MSEHATQSRFETPPTVARVRDAAREMTGYWWLGLMAGIAWLVVSLVILQFDDASVTTVGVLVGFMFLLTGVETAALATVRARGRWAWAVFAGLFFVAALVCFVNPASTFAGLADILGFLFLTVAIWWMVRAFLERAVNPLWWLGLISGVLMTGVAFWTAGQFLGTKAYLLLVLAGIWALLQGVTDIARAFAVRRLHQQL